MILRKEKEPVRIDVMLQGALVEALCEPLQCLRALVVISEGKVGHGQILSDIKEANAAIPFL